LSTVLILPYQTHTHTHKHTHTHTHTHTHKDQTTNITTNDQTMRDRLFYKLRLCHPVGIEAPESIASHPAWVTRKQLVRDEWKAREEATEAMRVAGPPASKFDKLLSVATRHYINCLRKDVGATLEHDELVNEDFRSTMSPEMLATAPPAIKGTWNNIKEAYRFFKKTRKERAALHLPGPAAGATSCSCECCSAWEYVSKQRKLIKWQAQFWEEQDKADDKWSFMRNVGIIMLVWKLLNEEEKETKEKEKKEKKEKKKHTP
jgi:hypothetical protein